MKAIRLILLIASIASLMLGLALTAFAQDGEPVAQLPPDDAEYVGTDTCFACHSSQHRDWQDTLHARMIQDPVADPSVVIADFEAGGENVRMIEVDGESRPYTLDDVTFTLGSKYRQRFIMQTDDGFAVLPGQWNRDAEEWVEANPGDWLNDCAGCHTTGFNVEDLSFVEISVGCESCHGPGSTHVEAAEALPDGVDPFSDEVFNVRQQIVATVDAQVCGSCHTRGSSPDGEHGYPVGYVVGGPLDETMFVPVEPTGEEDDPNFWPDGTEKKHRQQFLTWAETGHASAHLTIQEGFGRPSCMDCHSTDFIMQSPDFPQEVVTLENAQFGITCVQCHDSHSSDLTDQLAAESYDLCVSCHTGTDEGNNIIRVGNEVHHPMREMFEGRPFLGIEASPSPHFANEAFGPVCASCHMVPTAKSAQVGDIASHTFEIILPTTTADGQPDSCTQCHTDGDPEDLLFFIEGTQEDTLERIEDLTAEVDTIYEEQGWDVEAEDKPETQLIADEIRTLVSFVEADGSLGIHNPDFSAAILDEAEDLLDELFDELDL